MQPQTLTEFSLDLKQQHHNAVRAVEAAIVAQEFGQAAEFRKQQMLLSEDLRTINSAIAVVRRRLRSQIEPKVMMDIFARIDDLDARLRKIEEDRKPTDSPRSSPDSEDPGPT